MSTPRFSVLLPLALAVVLISCRSGTEAVSDSMVLPDFSLERIDRLLEAGENLKAIPLIIARERLGNAVDLRLTRATKGLQAEWEAAKTDGDWRRAITYLRSFKALGKPIEDVGEKDFFLQGVRFYLDKNQVGAAAALLQSEVDIAFLSSKTRQNLAEIFADHGQSALVDVLERRAGRSKIPSMNSLVDGTVTVWVNKGTRLVGGVGVPDRAIGSGFFVDFDGYILTNYHVIESEVDPAYQGYSRLFIKLDDDSGERIPTQVVGWEKNFDLALLKTVLDAPYVFGFADDDSPELGDRIFAIGSPGGLSRSMSTGTVSAYSRAIPPMSITGSLQIDVPINPGNSGGPLLNGAREVIGVIFAGIEQFEGVNFAIPGRYVKQLLPRLYHGGQVELSWMGVSGVETPKGLEVVYIIPGGPADEAGLQPEDLIMAVDGRIVKTVFQFQEYLLGRSPGTLTRLTWRRDGKVIEGLAALGVRPDIPVETALVRDAREHLLVPIFGMKVERISGRGLYKTYRITRVFQGSAADEAGFSVDDIFFLRKWMHDEEYGIVAIQLVIKGRKTAFLENVIQLAAYQNVNTFF